jgi:hypothetical protein
VCARACAQPQAREDSVLTRSKAFKVLGLRAGASTKDIIAAWKALLKRVHPDCGGSDFTAKLANEAKETLTGARPPEPEPRPKPAPYSRNEHFTWHPHAHSATETGKISALWMVPPFLVFCSCVVITASFMLPIIRASGPWRRKRGATTA